MAVYAPLMKGPILLHCFTPFSRFDVIHIEISETQVMLSTTNEL